MKKIIFLLMAFCLAMPAMHAELTSKQIKTNEKLAKSRAKDLKKQGYQVMGSLPMEAVITEHLNKKVDKDLQEKPGISTRTKSKNNGRQLALNNAIMEYAAEMSTDFANKRKGLNETGLLTETEVEQLSSVYLAETQHQLRGEMKESYSLIKENSDGTYEVMVMYLIDPEAATNARARAIEKTIEEQKLSGELAKAVRDSFSY